MVEVDVVDVDVVDVDVVVEVVVDVVVDVVDTNTYTPSEPNVVYVAPGLL